MTSGAFYTVDGTTDQAVLIDRDTGFVVIDG